MTRLARASACERPVFLTRTLTLILVLSSIAGWACSDGEGASTPTASTDQSARARNVILFIGDGVDDSQLTIGRNYLLGADGEFSFDGFSHRATAKVLTVEEDAPDQPQYVGDSASGGTALSAGVVTSRGRIATTAGTDQDVVTILELAEAAGKRTGIVTTASLTDATPASFVAHISRRFCEGPADMDGARGGTLPGCQPDKQSNGGPGSISEQIAQGDVEVLLGGGRRHFDQVGEAGANLIALMRERGYAVVEDADQLARLPADTERVLGLFGASTLPVEWSGEEQRVAEPVLVSSSGELEPAVPFSCVPNPAFGERPTLESMTRRALEMLSEGDPEQGFFLMIESASIDKQAHAANPCGQIGETKALDDSVRAAMEFAEGRDDTLIVVSSDHGHSAQIVPHPSMFEGAPQPQYPPGKVAVVETMEGSLMGISYGSNKYGIEEHIGTQIPVYAQGPGAHRVQGLMRQGDVFDVMREAMGLGASE